MGVEITTLVYRKVKSGKLVLRPLALEFFRMQTCDGLTCGLMRAECKLEMTIIILMDVSRQKIITSCFTRAKSASHDILWNVKVMILRGCASIFNDKQFDKKLDTLILIRNHLGFVFTSPPLPFSPPSHRWGGPGRLPGLSRTKLSLLRTTRESTSTHFYRTALILCDRKKYLSVVHIGYLSDD